MAFLTPDKVYTLHGLEIKEKILPTSLKPDRLLSDGTGKAEYVTIHNTPDINEAEGTNDAEQYARATFNGNMNGVSVHYYIDETDCWKILYDNEMGYHAADGKGGKGNTTSLAIEIVMDGSGSTEDIKAEERGAKLAAILLYENGLGIERLTTHKNWYSKKYCPAFILPHWDKFRNTVKKCLEEIENTCNAYTVGDVDGDGKVTAADARLTLRASVGNENLTDEQKTAADTDGDGKITAGDSREILRMSTGLSDIKKVPCTVKVTSCELEIRDGAGRSYALAGVIRDSGVYTIVEERNGWGKLKSGAGWIELSETKRVN